MKKTKDTNQQELYNIPNLKSLKLLSTKELLDKLVLFKASLFGVKFQNSLGKLGKTHYIKKLRRTIARVYTILNSKKKNGENVIFNLSFKNINKENQTEKSKK